MTPVIPQTQSGPSEQAKGTAAQTESSKPSETRWPKRFLYWGIFLVACVLGLVFQEEIGRGLGALIPPKSKGQALYWTSPHDPSFRSDHPGKDGMGMDLIPVYADQKPAKPAAIDPVLQETNFSTAPVEKKALVRTIRTVSTVAYPEPLIGDVSLKVDAWLEKLHVNYEGQFVKKGDPLFEVYAPQLVATQEAFLISLQFLEAARKDPSPTNRQMAEKNVQTARKRLSYWDVSEKQLDELARTKVVRKTLTFYSPFTGFVTEKKAFDGAFFPAGKLLYRIADLAKVWTYAYVYQDQIHCVYEGQKATLTIPNLPGRKFEGKVIYIYPYLEPKIRAVKVRLEFDNRDLALKPDMFTQVEFEPHQMGAGLVIPSRAVLDTGLRQLAYVALPGNRFDPREVKIGRILDGDGVEVLAGLREGEQVVTSSEFLLDSESRLRLINPAFQPFSLPMPVMPNMPEKRSPPDKMDGMKHDKHKH